MPNTWDEATKQKISQTMKGHKQSVETCQKRRETWRQKQEAKRQKQLEEVK